jgi:hypothetical protein
MLIPVEYSIAKNVRDPAPQSIHNMLNRVERDVLLHHFDALKRGS